MAVASIKHIDVDDNGIARIVGKRTKVIQIVMDKMANDWNPEEIRAEYSHLSLAEIHAAFAYYYDHQAELDLQIERDVKEADARSAAQGESDVVEKLRDAGQLS
jgi:uncharacterized protein (DUF433 family)